MSILRSFCLAFGATLVPFLTAQERPAPDKTGAAANAGAQDASARPVAPAGLVVGVVDLEKALELYPRKIKENERLQNLKVSYDEQIQQATKRIEELKGLIPLLKDGTRERALKQLELEQAMQGRQSLAKLLEADFGIEEMRGLLAMYEDLDVALARLAKDRGVHLILRLDTQEAMPGPEAEKLGPRQVQNRVVTYERRKVWFAAEELDLTPALIKMLQVPLEPAQSEMAPAPRVPGKDGK